MTIRKLTAMPYAQAHVEIDDKGVIDLFSYATRVATISEEGWLTVYGLYSMTARRHLSAFMKEYGKSFDYYNAKAAYEGNYSINIKTGEINKGE